MNFYFQKNDKSAARRAGAGFTLMEILISFLVCGLLFLGLIYGYVQANRMAEWCSMSLAAQASASRGAEQAREANWRPYDYPISYGLGGTDEWTNGQVVINYDYLDVPVNGTQIPITNTVSVTTIGTGNPPLRQITSQTLWSFPLDGTPCTNTVIIMRAPDQ